MTLGLNDEEVKEARLKYGSNKLEKYSSNSFIRLLLESLGDPIIKILLIALMIKIVFLFKNTNIFETLGIMIAIFLASFISTISEYGSNKAFERLQKENEEITNQVYRNGKLAIIKTSEIVVGDIVKLSSGDKIPADGHLIKGKIDVDESFLTGETKEIHKQENSKVYGGSVIYHGDALLKVDTVGNKTYIGQISINLQSKNEESPLHQKLRILAKQISKLGYIGAFLAIIAYLFLQIVVKNSFNLRLIMMTIKDLSYMSNLLIYCLTLAVTIIIMAVPEGLPMMITLVLSSNMKKMLKDHVLVRKMVGIETSGCLNVLLCDKTGTLTEGKLKVKMIISRDEIVFNHLAKINTNYLEILFNSLDLNNECRFVNNTLSGGNATDQAIRRFIGQSKSTLFVINRQSFDSRLKYSYVLASDNNYYLKGASEVVIAMCQKYMASGGQIKELNNKSYLSNQINRYTSKGYRVIATAYGKSLKELIFIGFVVMADTIRHEAKSSLDTIQKSGIKTIMITGDSKETALCIGNELGLLDNHSIILTHDEFSKLSDKELSDMAKRIAIIARALPEDKARLVRIYQNEGQVVGMTGDGINDAIALKKSDVGFALGSGTEVAKEAADIVILDDNIASICKAILYGRTIFKSIRKFIIYQLTVNICALLLSIVGTLIGYDEPITIIQMLWLNMIMDTFAGLAFSYEPPLKEYMEEKPKKRDEPIINHYMFNQIIVNGLATSIICLLFLKIPFIKTIFRYDIHENYFLTAFFALFVFLGIVNAFLARTHRLNLFAHLIKNPIFLLINLFTFIVQLFIIYFGGTLFRTFGLTFKEISFVLLLSLSPLIIDFLRKKYLKKKNIPLGV